MAQQTISDQSTGISCLKWNVILNNYERLQKVTSCPPHQVSYFSKENVGFRMESYMQDAELMFPFRHSTKLLNQTNQHNTDEASCKSYWKQNKTIVYLHPHLLLVSFWWWLRGRSCRWDGMDKLRHYYQVPSKNQNCTCIVGCTWKNHETKWLA